MVQLFDFDLIGSDDSLGTAIAPLKAICDAAPGAILPRPVFPYRRVRIQRDQGAVGLGYRSTV